MQNFLQTNFLPMNIRHLMAYYFDIENILRVVVVDGDDDGDFDAVVSLWPKFSIFFLIYEYDYVYANVSFYIYYLYF